MDNIERGEWINILYDIIIKFGKKDMKLGGHGMKDIFIGSRFVQDVKSILMWALYTPHKRPHIIDIDQPFWHFMTLKVEVIDPNDSIARQVNIALFN